MVKKVVRDWGVRANIDSGTGNGYGFEEDSEDEVFIRISVKGLWSNWDVFVMANCNSTSGLVVGIIGSM